MSAPKGYSSQEKEDRLSAQFQTIEPVRTMQFGSSVVAHEFVYEVGTDAAEAGSTASVIVATAHSALRGDVIRLTSGALSGREVKVWSVATNSITLAETLPSAVAAAVTFQIFRHKYPTVDSSGNVNVNAVIVEAAVAADGGALSALTKVVSGYDGAAVQVLKTDANGELQVDVLSSALPSGAATEAKQDSAIALLTTIDANTSVLAGAVSGTEMQVDVVSSALPSGAATEATLATLATEATVSALATEATVATLATEATLLSLNGKVTAVDTSNVTVVSSALPTGAATEVTLATLATETTVGSIYTELAKVSGTVSGAELQVDVVTSALPSGAATEATLATLSTSENQTNGSQKSQIVDGAGDVVDVVLLSTNLQSTDKALVTNTVIHGLSTAGGGTYVDVKVAPSGALTTESTLAGLDAAVLGQDTMANSLPIAIASDQTAIPVTDNGSSLTVDGTVAVSAVAASTGRSIVNRARHVYSSTPVTTAAYQQLLASTSAAVNEVEIFDSSGETLVLATGALGVEVDQAFVFPGGNGRIPLAIGSGVRVSIKAVSATASAGEVAINFYS